MPPRRRRARYVANNSDFRKHMMSGVISEMSVEAAKDVIPIAVAFSPESDPSEKGSGDGTRYQDHFFVDTTVVVIQDGDFSNPRQAARVVNDSQYAAQVEFNEGQRPQGVRRKQGGTHGTTPNRPLGRAGAFFSPETFRGGRPDGSAS